jgi:transcription elongation factor Elf1
VSGEQYVSCPECQLEIRLTAAERASGQAACLVCGARFKMAAQVVGTDPMRSFECVSAIPERRAVVFRTALCPRCERPAVLSAFERQQKRSYCAACDAEFDIELERLVSDVVAVAHPRDAGITESGDDDEMRICIDRRSGRNPMGIIMLFGMTASMLAGGLLMSLSEPAGLLVFAAVTGMHFIQRRGIGRLARSRRWPLHQIDGFRVVPGKPAPATPGSQIIVPVPASLWVHINGEKEPILLAGDHVLQDSSLAWLCRRLEHAVRSRRR